MVKEANRMFYFLTFFTRFFTYRFFPFFSGSNFLDDVPAPSPSDGDAIRNDAAHFQEGGQASVGRRLTCQRLPLPTEVRKEDDEQVLGGSRTSNDR